MTRRAVHLIITGAVQGVGYRDWMMRQAYDHELSGWVRNLRDGSVEAVVAGDSGSVDSLTKACRQGPPIAQVTTVDVTDWTEPVGDTFELLPTV
jgi:acylphosphatase